ncbi:hypothetical protein M3Y98_00360000 [Aphelenchoides besseyi]|nr:hypothetical protein M3Y98_00360000 [Aphelenchoides besseyi]
MFKKRLPQFPLLHIMSQPKRPSPASIGKGNAGTKRRPRTPGRGRGGTSRDEDEHVNHATVATVDENSGRNAPTDLRPRKPAEIAMINFGTMVAAKRIEGLKAEFKEIQGYQPPDTAATAFAQHKDKNRYNNIPCFDRTRVVLKYHVPPDTDYIHANHVDSSLVKITNRYICTQGPTDATTNDFWRMVWQEKARHVVMLCRTIEANKPKCAQYYPLQLGESKVYGTITVTHNKNITLPNEKIFESLLMDVSVGEEKIQLVLHHFGVPQSGMGMLRILKHIRDTKDSTAIVHCSAGVGRTGTIMACEICLRVLLEGKELNVSVPDVVKELRAQRAASIQTEGQYIYLHRTLCEYVHAKKLIKDTIADFFQAYHEYSKMSNKPTAESSTPQPDAANPPKITNP